MALAIKLAPQSTWHPFRVSRWLLVIFIGLIIGAVDQVTKALAVNLLPYDGTALPLLGSWVTLHVTHNSGAALSLLDSATIVVTVLSCLLTLVLLVLALMTPNSIWAGVLAVIAGGGLSNIVDRGRGNPWGTGAVIDFIDYFGWFVGNVADVFVVVGVAVVFVLMLRGMPLGVVWLRRADVAAALESGKSVHGKHGVYIFLDEAKDAL